MKKDVDLFRYLLFAAALASTQLLGSNYITNLAIIIGLQAMPAIGLSLLMGYTGQISLGHAAFYGLGAYGSALIALNLGVNPWLSMAVATILVAGIGWGLGWLVFRLSGHHLAMATLGVGIIVHVCLVELREWTGGPNGMPDIPPLSIFGTEFYTDQHVFPIIWLVCIAIIFLSENLVRSPVGLVMKATGENEKVAASLGNAPYALKRTVLMISAIFASIGGGLYAHYIGYLSPSPFDVGFSIKLLLMVAIGGFARIWGVLFGVAFVTLVSEVLKPLGDYDIIVFGALLVWTMIYCPEGLLYRAQQIAQRMLKLVRRSPA
jgi:branched-chain amino acid transport system permease protein